MSYHPLPVADRALRVGFLWDYEGPANNTTGVLTPLLFDESVAGAYIVFTVVGIGKGFPAELGTSPVEIPIDLVTGPRVPLNGRATFGFVNALVDVNGTQFASSPGTVDYTSPPDGGTGAGGPGTSNDWAATNLGVHPSVALGTTFGYSGSGAKYSFDGSVRTCSAEVNGFVKVH